jgi:excinuclease ABC subunit B
LKFDEFEKRIGQTIYTSATPGNMKKKRANKLPSRLFDQQGLIDPELVVKPVIEKGSYKGQIFDFIDEAEKSLKKAVERLPHTYQKMAEDLSEY